MCFWQHLYCLSCQESISFLRGEDSHSSPVLWQKVIIAQYMKRLEEVLFYPSRLFIIPGMRDGMKGGERAMYHDLSEKTVMKEKQNFM